jgi:hypothetical protein
VGAEDLGEFVICSVVVPGEGVGNFVICSTEPLAVFSYFIREVVCRVKMGYFKSNSGLDGVLAVLDEIRLPQPAF